VDVVEITARGTWPVRHRVLRPGRPIGTCDWPEDGIPGAFHLGARVEGVLVGIASFYPVPRVDDAPGGWQIRGMAVDEGLRDRGLGAALLRRGVERARGLGATYLWCNARTRAVPFYERAGFLRLGAEFDVPGIGPHFQMRLGGEALGPLAP